MMVVQGLKRKLQDYVKDPGWENQLQSVLDLSMDKYERDRALAEPSLLRSVLITNTLRRAKTHMEAVSVIERNPKRRPAKGLQRERGTPSGFEDMDDDNMEDLSLSSAITTILQNLDSALDGSSGAYAPQRSPLASVGNLTGDGTCRKSLNKSLSHRLQDSVLDDLLLDFDTSISKGQMSRLSLFM